MTLNVRVSGSVWSSLIFDNVRQQGDKEGFLIGEVSMQEVTNISDSQINTTTRETTVNVISHTICPKPFSFYNRLGQVDREKLAALLKSNCDNVVGWFRCRSGSMPEPSLRENAIHHHLRDLLGTHYQNFLFGIFGEGSNMNHTTITYYYNFYTYNNGLFSPQKVAIENLGDTAQSEYKHGSSLNTESSGSDSYRDILTSHKKDMIDKDGYLQGMQGIKMTNEAIHDRMKTLKDSVVKSEDSVKRLVAEVKMLGQRVVQSHKAVQKEKVPEPPVVSTTEQLPERPLEDLNLEETREDNETSDRDNKLESQAPVADSDPFSSLIMDMKASISPPSKVRSNSDQIRKGLPDDILLKAEDDRKVRSNSGSDVPNASSIQRDKPMEVSSKGIRNRTKVEEGSESDSIQLPDSPAGLELSGSQTF
ncbi:BRISC complex subunit Abraxas 2-like isoform X2 [Apostichopus japonicus]|uniref:BRISC complex subunit Abraxas 2-like isoform X2 n=1 Tax=Stichopus japonicus TaxID=307972 RepID=UPI003AB54AE9